VVNTFTSRALGIPIQIAGRFGGILVDEAKELFRVFDVLVILVAYALGHHQHVGRVLIEQLGRFDVQRFARWIPDDLVDANASAPRCIVVIRQRTRKADEEDGVAGHRVWIDVAAERDGLLDRLLERATKSYVPPTIFAWIHLGLGEIDRTFEWLDRAVEERDQFIMPIKSYSFFDPIRSDRRFAALLRKMRLDVECRRDTPLNDGGRQQAAPPLT
jgi:hypothetical protein